MAGAFYTRMNSAGVLALTILETIVRARYPGVDNPTTTLDYPHEALGTAPVEISLKFGYELFDGMLSYCSCLLLAQYVHDQAPDGVPEDGPDFYRDDLGRINRLIEEFMNKRAYAYGVVANTTTPAA